MIDTDQTALDAATKIMSLFNGPALIGGNAQLKAGVQLVVAEALATQPPAVGVDVSEEVSAAWRECYSATIKALAVMVTAGAPEAVDKWDVVDRSAITGQVIKIREAMDKFNKPFLTAALRTGGGE